MTTIHVHTRQIQLTKVHIRKTTPREESTYERNSPANFLTMKTNRRTNFPIYSGTKFYMFRTRINWKISASVGFYCKEIRYDAPSYNVKKALRIFRY